MKRAIKHLEKIQVDQENATKKRINELEAQIEGTQGKCYFKIGDRVRIKKARHKKKIHMPYGAETYKVKKILTFANSLLLEGKERSETVRKYRVRVHMRFVKKLGDGRLFEENAREEMNTSMQDKVQAGESTKEEEEEKEENVRTSLNRDLELRVETNVNEVDSLIDSPRAPGSGYELRKRGRVDYKQ